MSKIKKFFGMNKEVKIQFEEKKLIIQEDKKVNIISSCCKDDGIFELFIHYTDNKVDRFKYTNKNLFLKEREIAESLIK